MVTNLASPRRFARECGFPIGAQHWVLESLEARTCLSAAVITSGLAVSNPSETPAQLVAQANNTFAINLYNQLSNEKPGSNVFFSPYSISTAMGMVLQGANGTTANEIINALDLPGTDIANAGIQALHQLFQANSATDGYSLSTANALWANNNFPLLQSFLTTEQNVFGAGPQTVDFSNSQAAANTINAWVSNQTGGKIPDLITPDMITPLTELILTNAIYFKGGWANGFDSGLTQSMPFQDSNGQTTTVQMMNNTANYGYFEQSGPNGYQALQIPFKGGNLDLDVILPTDPNLADFQSTLTPGLLSQLNATFGTTSYNVDLSLPRFEMNETYNLVLPLENLGIQTVFSNAADLSGISAIPLKVSFVKHQAVIQVDETGSEAAGATAIGGVQIGLATSPQPVQATFDANHPFIFAIVDHSTGTMLFMGSVTDPGNDTAAPVLPPANPVPPTNPIPVNLPPPDFDQPNPVATPAADPAGPGGSIAAVTPVHPSTNISPLATATTPSVEQGVIQAATANGALDLLGKSGNESLLI